MVQSFVYCVGKESRRRELNLEVCRIAAMHEVQIGERNSIRDASMTI